MRNRAWRRYTEDKIVIKRLKMAVSTNNWFSYIDVNGHRISKAKLKDYIGSDLNHMFKTYKTDKWETKHKPKYSPNKDKQYWRYKGDKKTRESDRVSFLKLLKEHGLK